MANTPIVLGFTGGEPILGTGGIDLGGELDEDGNNIEYVLPEPTPLFDTFSRNFVALYGLINSLPGSTCFEAGFKLSSLVRFGSGMSLDGDLPNSEDEEEEEIEESE